MMQFLQTMGTLFCILLGLAAVMGLLRAGAWIYDVNTDLSRIKSKLWLIEQEKKEDSDGPTR